ncbi:hypothetical protein HPB52_017166 [Rhipicephalus sanguineus]|uniref:Uncharacterized protein n=1 Tax=Rhipicephalus sanguineus TaxID=34632 RepID=A0A9D4PP70_RHISA|nr:hypothetical protein HPB52_017166 [Rhipicephalus sanguineus]
MSATAARRPPKPGYDAASWTITATAAARRRAWAAPRAPCHVEEQAFFPRLAAAAAGKSRRFFNQNSPRESALSRRQTTRNRDQNPLGRCDQKLA